MGKGETLPDQLREVAERIERERPSIAFGTMVDALRLIALGLAETLDASKPAAVHEVILDEIKPATRASHGRVIADA